MEGLLRQPQWRIIDQSAVGIHFQALQSFGTDDTLCASVGTGEAPATARTWVHHKTIVLRHTGYKTAIFTRRKSISTGARLSVDCQEFRRTSCRS